MKRPTRPCRRVAVVTGSRAEYGLLRPVISAMTSAGLDARLIVAGMHLQAAFGATVEQIEAEGVTIDARIELDAGTDAQSHRARAIGRAIGGFTDAFEIVLPDTVLVLGDRVEVFAAATAAAASGIAVAHVHGGDVTRGGFDESMRHAITKLAHVHFAATSSSFVRIQRMGEEAHRIHLVGAPAMDTILHTRLLTRSDLAERLGTSLEAPLVVLVQHPVSTRSELAVAELAETLDALRAAGHRTVGLFPNSDPGGRATLRQLTKAGQESWLHVAGSLDQIHYLSLLGIADVLVGNSSSGIIEAPAFKLPVVNIGDRQAGRERASNVIDVLPHRQQIEHGLKTALSPEFRAVLADCVSPYGDGTAGPQIAAVLGSLQIDEALLQKQLAY